MTKALQLRKCPAGTQTQASSRPQLTVLIRPSCSAAFRELLLFLRARHFSSPLRVWLSLHSSVRGKVLFQPSPFSGEGARVGSSILGATLHSLAPPLCDCCPKRYDSERQTKREDPRDGQGDHVGTPSAVPVKMRQTA